MLILHVTSRCNLACPFCFSQPFVEIGLKDWKTICDKNLTRTFSFTGGEPLLVWEEITKPLIEYIQDEIYPERYSDVDITTNGTLLTDEIAAFLQKRRINVGVSFHGNKAYMDSLNSDYYNRVIAGLDLLQKYGVSIRLRMTATKDNLNQILFVKSMALHYNTTFSIIQRCFGTGLSTSISEANINSTVANKNSFLPLLLNSTWNNVNPCGAPAPAIRPDGKAVPCSAMLNTVLGDAITEDIDKIMSRWDKSMEFGCRRNNV